MEKIAGTCHASPADVDPIAGNPGGKNGPPWANPAGRDILIARMLFDDYA